MLFRFMFYLKKTMNFRVSYTKYERAFTNDNFQTLIIKLKKIIRQIPNESNNLDS